MYNMQYNVVKIDRSEINAFARILKLVKINTLILNCNEKTVH